MKKWIYLLLFVLMAVPVFADLPTFIPTFNPFGGHSQLITDTNQSGVNWTFESINTSLDCSLITGGSDSDYCVDTSGAGGGSSDTDDHINNITSYFGSDFNSSVNIVNTNTTWVQSIITQAFIITRGFVVNTHIYSLISGNRTEIEANQYDKTNLSNDLVAGDRISISGTTITGDAHSNRTDADIVGVIGPIMTNRTDDDIGDQANSSLKDYIDNQDSAQDECDEITGCPTAVNRTLDEIGDEANSSLLNYIDSVDTDTDTDETLNVDNYWIINNSGKITLNETSFASNASQYGNVTTNSEIDNTEGYITGYTETDPIYSPLNSSNIFVWNTTWASEYGNVTDVGELTDSGNVYQDDIGSDCSAGDFVKGVDDDGTLDCDTPASGAGGGAGDKWLDSGSYISPNSSFASWINASRYKSELDGIASNLTPQGLQTGDVNGTNIYQNGIKVNDSVLIDTAVVGGEVSGTIGNIVLDHDALDDQYLELTDNYDTSASDDTDSGNFSSSQYINFTVDSNGFKFSLNVSESLCIALTGSSALCDGSDATGGSSADTTLGVNTIYIVNESNQITRNHTTFISNWTTLYEDQAYYTDANASDVSVGGEVSGTVGSITISNTALDDQYCRLGDEWNDVNATVFFGTQYAAQGWDDANFTDAIGNAVTGNTETRITVTAPGDGTFDFVVDNMNDDVPESGDFGNAADLDSDGSITNGNVRDEDLNADITLADFTNDVPFAVNQSHIEATQLNMTGNISLEKGGQIATNASCAVLLIGNTARLCVT